MEWNQAEIDFLIENYPDNGKLYCANKLNKTEGSIRSKASTLGLKLNIESTFFKEFQKRASASKIGKKRPNHSLLMKNYAKDGRFPILTKERTLEDRIKSSKTIKNTLNTKGHPKGFLGKKHNEETKKKMGIMSKNRWDDKESKFNSEEFRQKMSNKQSLYMQNKMKPENIYSNAKHGTIQVGDNIFFARSSWEANIACYFEFLKSKNEIKNWVHEPETFWFNDIKRGVRSYKPDFLITRNDNTSYYVEVKGYMDSKSKTKLDRMNRYYPKVEIDLIDQKRYYNIAKMKGFIPNWGILDSKDFLKKVRLCSIPECNEKHFSLGFCRKHHYSHKKSIILMTRKSTN